MFIFIIIIIIVVWCHFLPKSEIVCNIGAFYYDEVMSCKVISGSSRGDEPVQRAHSTYHFLHFSSSPRLNHPALKETCLQCNVVNVYIYKGDKHCNDHNVHMLWYPVATQWYHNTTVRVSWLLRKWTHHTFTVDELNRQSDLGALVSATKRLEAPGLAGSRDHLVSIMSIMKMPGDHPADHDW